MGSTSYNFQDRSIRAADSGYHTKSKAELFSSDMHPSMSPKGLGLREARDSATHPNTVPIIVGMDETGSMGDVPLQLVKEGLPHLMSNLIEKGVPDAALLFLGIGDHKADRCPLQVGQFESGDAELDLWLTRTYLEGNGGGNGGESYQLAWLVGANHTVTDAWEKRGKKGYLFTIGDEPVHDNLPASAIKELIGGEASSYTTKELFDLASQKWNVYHIHINHTSRDEYIKSGWKALLGENCLSVDTYKEVANKISSTVLSNEHTFGVTSPVTAVKVSDGEAEVHKPGITL